MPDIAMCTGVAQDGTVCSLRKDCYRFTAKPDEYRQPYFSGAPLTTPDNCIYLVPLIRHRY